MRKKKKKKTYFTKLRNKRKKGTSNSKIDSQEHRPEKLVTPSK